MKICLKYILLLFVLNFFNSFGQESPFNAMVFKSIINDENNLPIKSKKLVLNVELFSENTVWYKEKHTTETDQNGIVNLKIGAGTDKESSFDNIPWATSEIKIRIKYVPEADFLLAGSNFKTLETTALYAVPYAFHALSANNLTSSSSTGSTNGNSSGTSNSSSSLPSKSEYWSAYGNRNIDMRNGFIGTVDNSPLVFKTNYLERLKISADGVTTFNSPLIVPRPFYATIDSLNVNKLNVNTISNLNANFIKLSVNSTDQSNTINDGALVVKGGVGIAKNLNVGENLTVNGNVNILGQMNFDGGVNFNAPIQTQSPITINDTSESYTEDNGALVVKGGVGIKKNVNIGGNIFGNKNLTITDNVIIKGSQNSTTKDDGNLLLENGGLGVEKNIFAGGNITTNSNMFVDKNLRVTLNSDLNTLKVNGTTEQVGVITVNNITISNNINEGALIVKGGVGIGDNLNVGKNLKVTENATIIGALSSNSLSVNNNFELLGTQESTTKDTGALIVQNGGLGVERNTFVGGKIESNGNIISNSDLSSLLNTNVGNNLNVVNQSNLNLLNVNSTTNIKGITTVDNNTISNTINQGALVVKGGVGIGDNLNVGKNLKVTENALVSGALSSNSLTVNTNFELLGTQEATTKDTGALIIQNGGLGVEKNTFVGGKIESNGDIITNSNLSTLLNTTVGNNLSVVNQSNLNLVNINSTTNIKGITTVENGTISNSPTQGALVVNGGVGIGDNINVGKNLKVNGFTNLLDDTTLSKKISVNGIATFNDILKIESTSDGIENKALQVKGGALINGSTSMDGALKINSLLNPAPQDISGAASFKTVGGAIVAGNLNVGGSLNVAGPINYRAGLTTKKQMIIDVFDYYDDPTTINLLNNVGYGRDLRYDSYALKINAVNQGIAIKVNRHDRSNYGAAYGDDNNAVVTTGNNFLSFWDNTGKMVGRVEGENIDELVDKNFTYVNKTDRKNVMIATRAIDVTILGLKDAIQALKTQQASAKYAAAAGLNSIITPSGNGSAPTSSSKLNEAASKLMEEQAKLVLETANLSNKLVQFALDIALVEADLANSRNKVGVKYSSSSGDYAEYLELQNPKEATQIKWGNVVGIKGGKIALNTNNADKIMVVSMSPAVVGNMPEEKDIDKYKPVAFMGQIPVIVINNAKIGDYILPSGNNDGLAIAKPADALEIDDYKQIIGVAWEDSNAKSIINVAVGINTNDVVSYIKKQDNKLTELENRINKLEHLINNNHVAQNGTNTDSKQQSTINYKTEFINVLDKSESNQKIIADIKDILKTKNINNLNNKQIYIDRVVQEYLGINQNHLNKLDPTQRDILIAYLDAIKFKVMQS